MILLPMFSDVAFVAHYIAHKLNIVPIKYIGMHIRILK